MAGADNMHMSTNIKPEPNDDIKDFSTVGAVLASKFAYSAAGSTPSTPIPSSSHVRGVKPESSPTKPILEPTRKSTRVRRGTVKQELLNTSFPVVKTVKQEVVGKVKKINTKRGYASPEQYAHLQLLPEFLKEELDILFCGINPAVRSAQIGHHYGHGSNHFWPCLVASGLTNGEQVTALEDHTISDRFNFGLAAELSKKELAAGVPSLVRKIARYRPRIIALVGKLIWDAIERGMKDLGVTVVRSGKAFLYDIQPYKVVHPVQDGHEVRETLFFVLPSSSARVMKDKTELFALLKQRLQEVKHGRVDTSSMTVVRPSAK
ncbi:uracil-DNA glycosylase-like protein [Rhodofomes roseus]|uniref:Uracil-DNA glycosylase-like protein n=1 Tax=Rhodofomes roseus TaxID=34475 RepID=A0ABQ8K0A4_9APHY|nr:uracil-DNA glycosylase-like protein [Rhodofomes roseus]KAH9830082.1 uracil-DNA glycosylase-like protein [Rhodofomes roseus]